MSKFWYVVNKDNDVVRVSTTPIDDTDVYDNETLKCIEVDTKLRDLAHRVTGTCDVDLSYGIIKFILDYFKHENVEIAEPILLEEIFSEAYDDIHNLLCEKLNSFLLFIPPGGKNVNRG